MLPIRRHTVSGDQVAVITGEYAEVAPVLYAEVAGPSVMRTLSLPSDTHMKTLKPQPQPYEVPSVHNTPRGSINSINTCHKIQTSSSPGQPYEVPTRSCAIQEIRSLGSSSPSTPPPPPYSSLADTPQVYEVPLSKANGSLRGSLRSITTDTPSPRLSHRQRFQTTEISKLCFTTSQESEQNECHYSLLSRPEQRSKSVMSNITDDSTEQYSKLDATSKPEYDKLHGSTEYESSEEVQSQPTDDYDRLNHQ